MSECGYLRPSVFVCLPGLLFSWHVVYPALTAAVHPAPPRPAPARPAPMQMPSQLRATRRSSVPPGTPAACLATAPAVLSYCKLVTARAGPCAPGPAGPPLDGARLWRRLLSALQRPPMIHARSGPGMCCGFRLPLRTGGDTGCGRAAHRCTYTCGLGEGWGTGGPAACTAHAACSAHIIYGVQKPALRHHVS